MSLRVRFQYSQGATLGYSIERLADGYNYDFQDGTFKNSTPITPIASLTAGTGTRAGIYSATLASTPVAQFSNGDYAIYINNTIALNAVIGVTAAVMYNGDDSTVFATSGGTDPWATILPASYPAGSAGALLGTNLDAKVSSRSTFTGGVVAGVTAPVTIGTNNDKTGYSLSATDHTQLQSEMTSAIAPVKAITDRIQFDPSNLVLTSNTVTAQPPWYAAPPTVQQIRNDLDANSTRLANLDAKVSSRSTFTGGVVAGVTAPVTVGTNNDKTGYSLSATDHTQLQSEMTSAIAPVKAITDRIQFDPSNLVLTSNTVTAQPPWYAAPPTVQQIRNDLDANSTRLALLDASISSRSTYAGGMVAGVTAPVTVGTNNDKSGYILAASGMDAVMIEPSVNARQALSPILAAAAGAISGAGTGTIVIKGGSSTTSRIMATTDNAGNRSSVVLMLPT